MPEGVKLTFPLSASWRSNVSPPRSKRCGGGIWRRAGHDGGDPLPPQILRRDRSGEGLQKFVKQFVDPLGGHIGGSSLYLDGAPAEVVDVESQGREIGGVLLQQVVFVARENQPLREEQLLADRRAVAEHEQVGVEKHPFVRTPQVGHDETASVKCGGIAVADREHRIESGLIRDVEPPIAPSRTRPKG